MISLFYNNIKINFCIYSSLFLKLLNLIYYKLTILIHLILSVLYLSIDEKVYLLSINGKNYVLPWVFKSSRNNSFELLTQVLHGETIINYFI